MNVIDHPKEKFSEAVVSVSVDMIVATWMNVTVVECFWEKTTVTILLLSRFINTDVYSQLLSVRYEYLDRFKSEFGCSISY